VLERLKRNEVIIGDGAWGTMLMARGLEQGQCPESVNLDNPDMLREVAALYLDAGAELVTTNSFGGSPLKLEHYGMADATDRVNRAAAGAVRDLAHRRGALVSGSVGPCGKLLRPYGDADPAVVEDGFRRQVAALAEGGADVICIETMIDLEEARLAVRAARAEGADLPLMATMTFDDTPRGFFTIMGTSVKDAGRALADEGVDVIGSNCGHGVEQMVGIAAEFRRTTDLPVLIQANAGLPKATVDGLVYPEDPESYGRGAERLFDLGVAVIGGCCGTTPEHIRILRTLRDRRAAR
jgi:5-methyltetrahydrofolate--homocysteine methyltransferase